MAGDWIKIDHTTPDKPEVFQIAEALDIDPDAVVGKLIRVWVWADQQTRDGNAPSVTVSLLDRLAAVSGFAHALEAVGWLETTDVGVRFANFDRHNGSPSKARALGARRTRQHREMKRECNGASVTKALPEKRREEKSIRRPSDSCCVEPEGSPQQPVENDLPAILEYPTSRTGETWALRQDHLDAFADCYPGIDVLAQCRAALGWCIANPKQRKTASGMMRFLNGWLAKAQNQARGSPPPTKSSAEQTRAEARRIYEAMQDDH